MPWLNSIGSFGANQRERWREMNRIVSNLTKWEVGQDLIAICDLISEKDGEIRNSGFIEESNTLQDCRKRIAEVFNKLDSHGFRL